MNDESLSVSVALYTCSCSRAIFRCFMDTILSATAMPCNKDNLNPMPQLRGRQAPAMFPKKLDLETGRERKRRGKKWKGNLVP